MDLRLKNSRMKERMRERDKVASDAWREKEGGRGEGGGEGWSG